MRSVYATKGISHQDLNAVRDAYWSPAEINSLRGFLYDSARYGLPDTIPDKVTETDNDAGREIALKAANTITAIEKLMEQAAPSHALPEELDDKVKVDKLSEAAKILLGKSFTIVPQFDLRNKQELGDILAVPADQGIMRNAPEFAMESWVEGLSKVRTKINRLEMVNTMSTMFETGFPDYQPIQLPFDTVEHDSGESVADYWMGL
jgi:hypothetical protein